jgi:hypothetical protein
MSTKNKVKDIMEDTSSNQAQEQINENLFHHFKYR